jgi:GR25 family glycosyltransferase involved in LPS biosynthesis
MSYVNQVVDKVYLINLDRDTERLKTMIEQLNKLNIEFTRFPAVLGANVKTSHDLTDFCLKYCTDGIKGCAMSHKTIWNDMLKNNYKYVLVLEDDAVFADDFEHMFKTGWDQVPKDFDIWYLGCNFKCTDTKTIPMLYNSALGHTPKPVDTHIQRVHGSVGTHGYIISNKCAMQFKHLPIYTHIDAQMTIWLNKYKLNAYSVKPLIINTPQQEVHSGSNLAESYPYLLNGALRHVPFSDTVSLDWGASENFAKIGGHNVNVLILIMILLTFLTVPNYYFLFGIWLFVEFIYSKDWKNTAKFATFIGGTMLFKWVFHIVTKESATKLKKTGKDIIGAIKSHLK